MLPKRLRVSKSASDILKLLKGRTGLTPNILCRMALLRSLEEGQAVGLRPQGEAGTEFNAPTLFGEYAVLFEALIREVHGELDPKDCAGVIASHIDNGLDRLRKPKSLLELLEHAGFSTRAAGLLAAQTGPAVSVLPDAPP